MSLLSSLNCPPFSLACFSQPALSTLFEGVNRAGMDPMTHLGLSRHSFLPEEAEKLESQLTNTMLDR